MSAAERERPQIGDVRWSYLLQPCAADGREVNGGMSYANANSREDAEQTARRMLGRGADHLGKVTAYGREMEFYGPAWRPVKGGATDYFEVTRADVGLPPVLVDPRGEQRCWDTTVMDYFETVHVMLTDGSCVCGDPTRNTR